MQVIFYKAMYGNFFDKLIAWWTSSFDDKISGKWRQSYSHCEILFDDGQMFSASQYENLTRFKKCNTDSKVWKHVDIKCTMHQIEEVRSFCVRNSGRMYDYLGVLGFIICIQDDKHKWFCSEIVTAALLDCTIIFGLKPSKTSPNGLYQYITEGINNVD